MVPLHFITASRILGLVVIYHVLRTKEPYAELGADYFDKLDTTRIQQHHIRRLEQLGFTVTLTPKEAV
jgi:transposase